jgi:Protein of unknown function (DUF1761)
MNNFIIFVALSTIIQYIISALWYSAIFGKQWMVINEFDKKTKAEQDAVAKSMGPYYGLQLLITILANYVFGTVYLAIKGNMDLFAFGGYVLLGFIIPPLVEGVIWGNTRQSVWGKQLGIMIFNRFINVLVSCLVAYYFLR